MHDFRYLGVLAAIVSHLPSVEKIPVHMAEREEELVTDARDKRG